MFTPLFLPQATTSHTHTCTLTVSLAVSTVTAASGFCCCCCCCGCCAAVAVLEAACAQGTAHPVLSSPAGPWIQQQHHQRLSEVWRPWSVHHAQPQGHTCSAISFGCGLFILTGAKVLCDICTSGCGARCMRVCLCRELPTQDKQCTVDLFPRNKSIPFANLGGEVCYSYWISSWRCCSFQCLQAVAILLNTYYASRSPHRYKSQFWSTVKFKCTQNKQETFLLWGLIEEEKNTCGGGEGPLLQQLMETNETSSDSQHLAELGSRMLVIRAMHINSSWLKSSIEGTERKNPIVFHIL